jgi:hypothetical protein
MKDLIKNGTYAFVSYEGSKLPEDPSIRNLIRRRAMRHTATIRKQTGGYGRHNVSQPPAWLSQPDEQDPKSGASDIVSTPPSRASNNKDTPRAFDATKTKAKAALGAYWFGGMPQPPTDVFMAAMSQNYSLLHLAGPMTVLHLGISTISYFRPDCACIGKTLSTMPRYLESRRLLSFIPSRYGVVSSITHATDCIIARLGHIVHSGGRWNPEGDMVALKHYAKALKSLQNAIDDESLRMMPETLCAVELLGIFEVYSTLHLLALSITQRTF